MNATDPARLLWFIAGFGLWSSALVWIYALHALGCAYRWPDGTMRAAIGATLGLHLVGFVLLIRRFPRGGGNVITAAQWTLIAALAATAATFGPLLFLTPCV